MFEEKSGWQIIHDVASMTRGEILHENMMKQRIIDAEEDGQRSIEQMKKERIENIPYLMNWIEEYVKLRIAIDKNFKYYKKPYSIFEPSKERKIERSQKEIINMLEMFVRFNKVEECKKV